MKNPLHSLLAAFVMVLAAAFSASAALPTVTKTLHFADAKFAYTQNGKTYENKSLSELPTNQGTTTSNHNNLLSNITITWPGEDVVVKTPDGASFNSNIGMRSYSGGLAIWGWNGDKILRFEIAGVNYITKVKVTAPAGKKACLTSNNSFKTDVSNMNMTKASDNSYFENSVATGKSFNYSQVRFSGVSYSNVVWDTLEITYVPTKTDNLKTLLEMYNAEQGKDVTFEGTAYVVFRGEANMWLQDSYGNAIEINGTNGNLSTLLPAELNKGYAVKKFTGKFSNFVGHQKFTISSSISADDCEEAEIVINPIVITSAPNSTLYAKLVTLTGSEIKGFSSGIADRLEMTVGSTDVYLTQVKPYVMATDENSSNAPARVSPLDDTYEYHFVAGQNTLWPHSSSNKLEFEGPVTATGFVGYSNGNSSIQCIELEGRTTSPTVLGIEDVVVDGENGPAVIYDLMGRRVEQMVPGTIYIVNGKKHLCK